MIAANTGCASDTDSLMAFSTSAVAVCRSSASRVSLNSRAFWIAITAWSANDLRSAFSLSCRPRDSRRNIVSDPMPRPCHMSGATTTEVPRPISPAASAAGCRRSGSFCRSRTSTRSPLRIAFSVRVPASGRGNAARVLATMASALSAPISARALAVMRITSIDSCPSSPAIATPKVRASNSRSQHSTIFSNTGFGSAIELPITCRTSAVAVCRSSASRVSLNRRTFSIAITAWSAKDCASAMSRVAEGLGLVALEDQHAHGPLRRAAVAAAARSGSPSARWTVCSCGGKSMADQSGMCSGARETSARDGKLWAGSSGIRPTTPGTVPLAVACRRESSVVALAAQERRPVAAQQPPCRADDDLGHRHHVVGRLADDAQDVGAGGLALQRGLGLVEQPRVVQRDHRLLRQAVRNASSRASNGLPPLRHTAIAPCTCSPDLQRHDHQALVGAALGAGDLHRARIGRGVVDELGLAALQQAADDAAPRLDGRGLESRRPGRPARRWRGSAGRPRRAGRSRCSAPPAVPWRARRCGPSPWPGRAWTTGRGRPRTAPSTRARGAASRRTGARSPAPCPCVAPIGREHAQVGLAVGVLALVVLDARSCRARAACRGSARR